MKPSPQWVVEIVQVLHPESRAIFVKELRKLARESSLAMIDNDDAMAISLCPICSAAYIQERSNASACSVAHMNILRVRNFRNRQ